MVTCKKLDISAVRSDFLDPIILTFFYPIPHFLTTAAKGEKKKKKKSVVTSGNSFTSTDSYSS